MAADQRKKRLNTTSITSSREQGKAKKKKLGLLERDLNVKSNISLEWDDHKRSVVAKREQIGLARRHLIPFGDNVPHCYSSLADVLAVPCEIFGLDNLKGVLSYEVWQTLLSEDERNYLKQFLPKGAEKHQVVKELLEGDNFHFGNPLVKWSSSLCSGNLHPDAVLHQEKCFKSSKKLYLSQLRKYHNGMIGSLLMWKERWASCKDPEKELVHKIWRSRRQAEGNISIDRNQSRFHDNEEDLAALSESDSWAADEKADSSDNQNLVTNLGELQKGKNLMADKYGNLSAEHKVAARPRKGEKLQKRNIQYGDGSKYMSYIKVSREQHERVKSSMKHSSNSIQSRSLHRVLGNLDIFHVQPFEIFEEEEQKKLHEYWLQLATRDIPVAFANRRTWLVKKGQLAQSFMQEIEQKLKSLKEDEENGYACRASVLEARSAVEVGQVKPEEERDNSEILLLEQKDKADNHQSALEIEDEQNENSDTDEQNGNADMDEQNYPDMSEQNENPDMDEWNGNPNIDEQNEYSDMDEQNENPDIAAQEMTDNKASKQGLTLLDDNESLPGSTLNQRFSQIPSVVGGHEFHHMDLSSSSHVTGEIDGIPPSVSDYPENLSRADIALSHGDPLPSSSDVWPAVSMSDSYYHPITLNHASSSGLSLGNSQAFREQPAQLIDLESDNHEQDTTKGLLHSQPSSRSFFNPYPNQDIQDRNELLQHFFKGQEGLAYNHEQRETGSGFQPAPNVPMETGPFLGHFREQLHPSLPLEPRQKRFGDMYTQQNIQEKMFSNGGRYPFPRKDNFSSVNVQDWAVNTTHMPVSLQSHLGGADLGKSWFSGEHCARGGWPSLDSAIIPAQAQFIGSRSNTDQSLFGAMSPCNELHPGTPYDSIGPAERFNRSGIYSGVGALLPGASNGLPPAANSLDYLTGPEAAVPVKNNLGWVSMPHQNSALQDSVGKPFLRSWNK